MSINVKFIPNAKADPGSTTLTLEQIPDEVKQVAEEVYAALKTNPGRMFVEFPTLGELNQFIAQIKAYCALRPAGAIHFRRSPSAKKSPTNPNGLLPTQMEFRITDKPDNGTEEIREATEKVKAAAAK